jgi:bacterioferritin-associated ferredoxin
MIVCLCRGLSETSLQRLIEAGATTLRQLAEVCGASADCGACSAIVEDLLADTRGDGRRGTDSIVLTATGLER